MDSMNWNRLNVPWTDDTDDAPRSGTPVPPKIKYQQTEYMSLQKLEKRI